MHCPKCGDELVKVGSEWTCVRGGMGLSQHAYRLLRDVVESDAAAFTPAKPTMGGSWHCPNDGTKLIDFRCPHCGRSLPTGLVYDLIEFHPHA